MAGARWTEAEEAALRGLYPALCNAEVAGRLNAEFGNGRNARSVGQRARLLGVAKGEGYVKPMPRTMWPDEKREWFRAFAPGHSESEISAEHERLFGTPLSESQIGNAKHNLGVKSGTHGGRFEKGHVPANKGKTWEEFGTPEGHERSRRTCFRKGEVHDRPDGWIKPVGFERVNKDGYVEVKVRDSAEDGIQPQVPGQFNCNYRMKHHVAWEEANGKPVPPNTMIVFADHDKRNFDPGNLVAVPRPLWVRICKSGAPYFDRESLEACMAAAALSNAAGKAARRPRPCGCCGSEFEPRYAHQRACDACLEAGKRAPRRRRATAGA